MTRGFPFYQQHDEMDCGATCLRMVARYHGRFFSLETLRELTYIGREGVTMLGISDAAEHIGLQTLAVQTTFDQLHSVIPLPCIAHWNDNHFVVIYKVTDRYVWIADPAQDKFRITKEEFLQHWASEFTENGEPQGVLLLLQTTPEFYQREGEEMRKSGLRYVLRYFKKYSGLIWQLFLGLILGTLIQLAFPFLIKAIVDVGINIREPNFIAIILVAQLVLFAAQTGVEALRSWILLHVGVRVNISLISDYIIKLTKLPLRFFDSRMTSDLMQRVADHERVQRFLSSTSLMSLFSFISFIAFALVLVSWSPVVFTVFLAGTVLYISWIFIFARWRREIDYRRFDQSSQNQSNLMELIHGMQDIKMFNAEKQKRWAWERVQAHLFRTGINALRVEQIQRSGALFINETKNLLIIFLVARAVIGNSMTLGMLVAVQYIIGAMNAQVSQLIDFLQAMQEARISLERLNEIHERQDEERVEDKITILPEVSSLHVQNLSFQYNGPHSHKVLKNISLTIPKGKRTAIVGSSGSGKTTLMKLLLNFYTPTEGAIRVGDINLENLSHKLWRSKCGVVMQDGFIFSDTIANNIALGDEIVDKVRLLEAVKLANIQSFVESLPMGYNTRIGADGLGLSQGQKQRLLIARSVYKNPDYLFFDEATTALDAFNEMVIMENLKDFFANKTVIVVAHRLSTVRDADNIIVLEDGEIAEQGTHEELTYVEGAYYQIVRNQLELGS